MGDLAKQGKSHSLKDMGASVASTSTGPGSAASDAPMATRPPPKRSVAQRQIQILRRTRADVDAMAVLAFLGVALMVVQHEVGWALNTQVGTRGQFCPPSTANIFHLSDVEVLEVRAAAAAAAGNDSSSAL
ncbi:unnamed protein product, partial [Symbiodinium sp. KB8]